MVALVSVTGGCASTAKVGDVPVEKPLDEARIGVSGPEQIEDAIETLDAQSESESPLVRELGVSPPPASAPSDLFERIREGFTLSDVDHPSVEQEEGWYVRHAEYLDRTFKRGERYLYHIVSAIEARGMPMEFALLPVVESAFNPVAYSRKSASGLWQFIPSTGRRYGLKQNWYYDGRRDVLAATTAALDYLEFLFNKFDGDWLLAVAAYNTGEGNVARAIRRNRVEGKPTDFFSLKLPRETRAYVPKLLAMRRIVSDPTAYGLVFAPIANQPFFEKVDLGSQVDLHVAASLAGLSTDEMLALNPAFNHWITDPAGPNHLLVPIAVAPRFAEAIGALPPQERVRVGGHGARKSGTPVVAASPHVVRQGESLWSIARHHGTTIGRLAATSGIRLSDTLSIGQVLYIPGEARIASAGPGSVPEAAQYIVRSGDTPSGIAHRFRVRLNDLLSWNDLNSRSIIKPGQRLVIYSHLSRSDDSS
jgi:membrane-bound lytic murein transglycosylase D